MSRRAVLEAVTPAWLVVPGTLPLATGTMVAYEFGHNTAAAVTSGMAAVNALTASALTIHSVVKMRRKRLQGGEPQP